MASQTLMYKRHPLRRKDNLIYYGSMSDKYIVLLTIMATEPYKDIQIPTRVAVQLQYTDPEMKSRDRVIKKTEKSSLYTALDVGVVWLERALTQK